MTRGNLLILLVLAAGVAGLFVWMLDLNDRQADLARAASAPPGPPEPGSERDTRIEALERKVEELDLLVGSGGADRMSIERRLREVEARLKAFPAASGLEPTALDGSEPLPGEAKLKAAVESVLAQRDAEDRKQRYQRMASWMSSRFLRDIEATDDQKSQFQKAMVSYLDERDAVRRKYSGREEDASARDAELEQTTTTRNAKLLEIFGATDYAKIEEQMNRGRQGFGGFPRGGRSGRGGR
jgi:hypothetical protein